MSTISRRSILSTLAGCPLFMSNAAAASQTNLRQDYFVFVGTYSPAQGEGLHVFSMDASGTLYHRHGISGIANPSYLALDPQYRYLYAVREIGDYEGKPSGAMNAYRIDPETAALQLLNHQPTQGTGPCYVTVDQTSRMVLTANYGGGSVTAFPIAEDGRLLEPSSHHQHKGSSLNPSRQEAPHAHSIVIDPTNTFAYAPDLGIDKIMIYRIKPEQAALAPNDPPFIKVKPGSGPRHFVFHPNENLACVIHELSNEITVFTFDKKTGGLSEGRTRSTLPEGFDGPNTGADIHFSPDGRFLYGSNRGHDSLALFSIQPDTGELTPLGYESTRGKTPRNFALSPCGRYLLVANQNSDTIIPFARNRQSGTLTPTGQEVTVSKPVCIKFMPLPTQL